MEREVTGMAENPRRGFEGDGEGVLDGGVAFGVTVGTDWVGARTPGSEVVLDGFPDAVLGLGRALPFGNFDVPPLLHKAGVGDDEGVAEVATVFPDLGLGFLDSAGEASAGMEVDTNAGKGAA